MSLSKGQSIYLLLFYWFIKLHFELSFKFRIICSKLSRFDRLADIELADKLLDE